MKLKIISLVVVFVFVVTMLPVNLFAHGSHTDCQDGTVVTSLLPYREYNGYHEHQILNKLSFSSRKQE